jgi:hypothetical protein
MPQQDLDALNPYGMLDVQAKRAAEQTPPPRGWRLVEDLLLIVAILPLWPLFLGWEGLLWRILIVADVILLGTLFVIRIVRFRRAMRELRRLARNQKGGYPPMMPPMPTPIAPMRDGDEPQ